MKFGIFLLCHRPDLTTTARERIAEALDQAQAADDLGFDYAWIGEHHFSNYGQIPSPLLFAIKVAERTRKIRVGTAVLVLPLYHPLRLAEEIGLADILTEGRLVIGIGRGYQEHEFSRYRVSLAESWERLQETVDILLKAWTQPEFEHEGKFFHIPSTTMSPKPVQQPHPEMWMAVGNPHSVRYAVEKGFKPFATTGLLPRSVLQELLSVHRKSVEQLSPPPHAREFAVQRNLYVTAPDEDPRAIAMQALWTSRVGNRLRSQSVLGGYVSDAPLDGEPTLDEVLDRTIIGPPDLAIERLRKDIEDGAATISCFMNFGRLTNKQVLGAMERFAKYVMPEFRDQPAEQRARASSSKLV